MRQLAAWVVTNRPEHVDWWTFRFEGWRRQLDHYLQAVLTQPKERRIRLTCPECGAKTVKITAPDGTKVNVPALVVDFNDGVMRAVECSNCAVTLAFRGEEMWTLAERIQDKETA
jgi:transcription elongation factor Elf1